MSIGQAYGFLPQSPWPSPSVESKDQKRFASDACAFCAVSPDAPAGLVPGRADARCCGSSDGAHDSSRCAAVRRRPVGSHLYTGDCPLEGPGVAGYEHMFSNCPECGHYDNQCLKCSALVDIGDACVCTKDVGWYKMHITETRLMTRSRL
eukprot:3301003-Prymnesium_polylepis.1